MTHSDENGPGAPPPQDNAAGKWGFVFSLIGLLCCAGSVLSWLGVILSAVGLRREPRGLAIAGLIIGLLGTAGGVAFWKSWGTKNLVPIASAVRQIGAMELETVNAMWQLEREVLDELDRSGALPATLAQATGASIVFVDQWGTELVYRPAEDGRGYHIHSAGPDTAWGTGDELTYFVRDAGDPTDFRVTRGTVGLIDATDPLYDTDSLIEPEPVPDAAPADEP